MLKAVVNVVKMASFVVINVVKMTGLMVRGNVVRIMVLVVVVYVVEMTN